MGDLPQWESLSATEDSPPKADWVISSCGGTAKERG